MDTMLRFSELASIDRKSVIFSDNSINFSLLKPRKSQKLGLLGQCLLENSMINQLIQFIVEVFMYIQQTPWELDLTSTAGSLAR